MREATAKSTSFIDAYIAACDIMQNGVPQWTDDTTPRTDRPVRFNMGLHQYESLQYGQLRATFRFSPSFIAR